MTDRELLELAAKAAGVDAEWHNDADADFDARHEGMFLKGERSPDNSKYWNPLANDGDALRLAVKLGIKVMPYPIFSHEKHGVIASRRWFAPPEDDEHTYVGPEIIEVYGGDPCAAARRAIVRAAAELGRERGQE